MNKTIGTLRQFFGVLCRIQSSAWFLRQPKWKPSEQALKAYSMLGSWTPIEAKEINTLLQGPNTANLDFFGRKVLYLPPLEKNPTFVPVLSLKCNIGEAIDNIRLRVMLVRCKDADGNLCGIGFRFESPENEQLSSQNDDQDSSTKNQPGRHDFYHTQIIQGLGWGPDIECPDWIPETQPSFPLAANDPITLLLCLLLSLYGKKYCWTFVTEYEIFNLRPHLTQIDNWYKRVYSTS